MLTLPVLRMETRGPAMPLYGVVDHVLDRLHDWINVTARVAPFKKRAA
jgi:hypothetical protein